jgi:hypothetical protein
MYNIFLLLPINGYDMNKTPGEINFHLTILPKIKEEERKRVKGLVKCAACKTVTP